MYEIAPTYKEYKKNILRNILKNINCHQGIWDEFYSVLIRADKYSITIGFEDVFNSDKLYLNVLTSEGLPYKCIRTLTENEVITKIKEFI